MSLPKDILPQVTAGELDAFSTIGGEERLIAFVNRFRELERERIDEILDGWQVTLCNCDVCKAVREIREAIKGERK